MNNKSKTSFEPSRQTLLRILKTMIDNGHKGKTRLSLGTNLNYSRLAKHVIWMEKKGLVKSVISENKIDVIVTDEGRKFYKTLSTSL